jgi:Protein of unknown function (DUF3305)
MRFAVIMRKQNIDNPWVSYRWVPHEVLPDFGQFQPPANSSKSISGQFLGFVPPTAAAPTAPAAPATAAATPAAPAAK